MTPAARERMRIQIPLFVASGSAWLMLGVSPHTAALCSMPSMSTPLSILGGSVLMVAAMMLPSIGPPLLHVRARTFTRRRFRSILLFLCGYGALWVSAGVLEILLAGRIRSAAPPFSVAAAIIGILAWQCSPLKQRCLNRCHGHGALAAFGVAADRDVLRFGLVHGFWCIGSCFALMLFPMLFASGHLATMGAATLWLCGERMEKPLTPQWRWRGPGKIVRIVIGQAGVWLVRAPSSHGAVDAVRA